MCQDTDAPNMMSYPSFVPAEIAKAMKSIGLGDDNVNLNLQKYIVSCMKECEDIQVKKPYLQSKIQSAKNKAIYRTQFKQLDSEYCKIGLALKKAVQGRIVHTMGQDSTIYEVMEYQSHVNSLSVRRIYDQNKILLDDSQAPMLVVYNCEQVSTELQFLTLNQEASVRQEMYKGYHTFKVQYQLDTIGGETECLPMSVEPKCIRLMDYTITFDKANSVIQSITNNQFGLVKYEAKEIDQSAGFIQNSVFEVWTNEVSDKIYNIIHCHINDMSESVPIATEYLNIDESVQDYMKFDTDSAGQELRFKILIQNHQILTVLYNSGASIDEIPFKETKFDMQDPLLQANITEFGDEPIIVKLNMIPTTMTCAHDKKLLDKIEFGTVENEPLTHCGMRYFERLPGYMDVQMVSGDN
jgi:hypothetical protein